MGVFVIENKFLIKEIDLHEGIMELRPKVVKFIEFSAYQQALDKIKELENENKRLGEIIHSEFCGDKHHPVCPDYVKESK